MSFLRDTSENPRFDAELLRHDLGALEQTAERDAAARASLLGRIAERCVVLGEHEAAVAHASEAVRATGQLGPRAQVLLPTSVIRLATALQYAGRHDDAIELFEQVVRMGDDHPGSERFLHYAWQHLGMCLTQTGERERAQECFERALQIRERIGDSGLLASTRAALAGL